MLSEIPTGQFGTTASYNSNSKWLKVYITDPFCPYTCQAEELSFIPTYTICGFLVLVLDVVSRTLFLHFQSSNPRGFTTP